MRSTTNKGQKELKELEEQSGAGLRSLFPELEPRLSSAVAESNLRSAPSLCGAGSGAAPKKCPAPYP